MHSIPKLALAIFTSPTAAFEEILERKLLKAAVVIVVLTGTVAVLPAAIVGSKTGPVQLYTLGKQNPLAWVGLCMLYAFALQKLLKWIGTQIDYTALLTIMGWSQLTLLLAQVITTIGLVAGLSGVANEALSSFVSAAGIALPVWYVAVVGVGIRTGSDAPLARGVMTYVVIEIAAVIAFTLTYGTALLGPFQGTLTGISRTAGAIVNADQTPWLAAGVIGLILGLWQIGKSLQWDAGTTARAAASAGLVGAIGFGVYVYAVWYKTDYYRTLARGSELYQKAQGIYDNNKLEWLDRQEKQQRNAILFSRSADQVARVLPGIKNNIELMLDVADLYYLAGADRKSIDYYHKARRALPNEKGPGRDVWLARIYNGVGAVYDFEGDYDQAINEFRKATKLWPEFREPWTRMGVTYNRMGEYKKAIDAADTHAIRKLDADSAVAWIVLAQAFTHMGDKEAAKTARIKAKDKDKDLAERIGDDWQDAVDKLAREDLKFPLEAQLAPEPEQPQGSKKAPPKKSDKKKKSGDTDK